MLFASSKKYNPMKYTTLLHKAMYAFHLKRQNIPPKPLLLALSASWKQFAYWGSHKKHVFTKLLPVNYMVWCMKFRNQKIPHSIHVHRTLLLNFTPFGSPKTIVKRIICLLRMVFCLTMSHRAAEKRL